MSRAICQWLWLAAIGLAFVTLFAEGMFRREQARRPTDGENKDREHLQTGWMLATALLVATPFLSFAMLQ